MVHLMVTQLDGTPWEEMLLRSVGFLKGGLDSPASYRGLVEPLCPLLVLLTMILVSHGVSQPFRQTLKNSERQGRVCLAPRLVESRHTSPLLLGYF